MGIAILPTTESLLEVVYHADPDVTPHNGAVGWLPRSEAEVRAGADIITVRPLNLDERMQSGDVDGLRASMLARCRAGMVAVIGEKSARAREQWLKQCPTDAIFLLGVFILAITGGDEPGPLQKVFVQSGETDAG